MTGPLMDVRRMARGAAPVDGVVMNATVAGGPRAARLNAPGAYIRDLKGLEIRRRRGMKLLQGGLSQAGRPQPGRGGTPAGRQPPDRVELEPRPGKRRTSLAGPAARPAGRPWQRRQAPPAAPAAGRRALLRLCRGALDSEPGARPDRAGIRPALQHRPRDAPAARPRLRPPRAAPAAPRQRLNGPGSRGRGAPAVLLRRADSG